MSLSKYNKRGGSLATHFYSDSPFDFYSSYAHENPKYFQSLTYIHAAYSHNKQHDLYGCHSHTQYTQQIVHTIHSMPFSEHQKFCEFWNLSGLLAWRRFRAHYKRIFGKFPDYQNYQHLLKFFRQWHLKDPCFHSVIHLYRSIDSLLPIHTILGPRYRFQSIGHTIDVTAEFFKNCKRITPDIVEYPLKGRLQGLFSFGVEVGDTVQEQTQKACDRIDSSLKDFSNDFHQIISHLEEVISRSSSSFMSPIDGLSDTAASLMTGANSIRATVPELNNMLSTNPLFSGITDLLPMYKHYLHAKGIFFHVTALATIMIGLHQLTIIPRVYLFIIDFIIIWFYCVYVLGFPLVQPVKLVKDMWEFLQTHVPTQYSQARDAFYSYMSNIGQSGADNSTDPDVADFEQRLSNEFKEGSILNPTVVRTGTLQSGPDEVNEDTLLKKAGAFFGTVLFGSHVSLDQILKCADKAFRFQRGITSIGNIWAMFSSFLTSCKETLLPDSRLFETILDHKEEVQQWAQRISEIDTVNNRSRLHWDENLRHEVLNLRQRASYFLTKFGNGKVAPELIRLLTMQYEKIVDLHNICEKFQVKDSYRVDPLCICLYGAPGVGKSTLAPLIANNLAELRGKYLGDRIYYRNKASEYWDSYTGQFAVVIDDFGQVKGQSLEKSFDEFMTLKSDTTHYLTMADLPNKGRPFQSEAIILSVNNPFDPNVPVKDLAAYFRRRDLLVEIKTREDATVSYKLKDVKLESMYNHVAFRIQDPERGQDHSGEWMTYEQFTEYYKTFATSYFLKQDQLVAIRKQLGRHLERFDDIFDLFALGDHDIVPRDPSQEITEAQEMRLHALREAFPTPEARRTWYQSMINSKKVGLESSRETVFGFVRKVSKSIYERICEAYSALQIQFEQCKARVSSIIDSIPSLKLVLGVSSALGLALGLIAVAPRLVGIVTSLFRSRESETPTVVKHEGLTPSGDEQTRHPVFRPIKSFTTQIRQEGIASSGDEMTKVKPTITPRTAVKTVYSTATLQSQLDPNCDDLIYRNVRKQTGVMQVNYYKDSSLYHEFGYQQNCVAVGGRVILTCAHFYLRKEEIELISVRIGGQVYSEMFDEDRLEIDLDHDLAIYEFGKKFPLRSDLVSHFIKDADLRYINSFQCVLPVSRARDGAVERVNYVGKALFSKQVYRIEPTSLIDKNVKLSDLPRDFIYHSGFVHDFPTINGDCGSLMYMQNPTIPRKIVGIHTLGLESGGYCALITQEMLTSLLKDLRVKYTLELDLDIDYSSVGSLQMAEGTTYLGCIDKSLQVVQPIKTRIRKTKLFERIFPIETEPAILSARDTRNKDHINPLKLGLNKYNHGLPVFDPDLIDMGKKALKRQVFKVIKPLRRMEGGLTLKEVLNGIPISEYLPIKAGTSAGYPYNLHKNTHGQSGKYSYLTGEPGDWDLAEESIVMDDLKKILELAQNCQPFHHLVIFMDTLKDERVTLEKIKNVKTRVFEAGPLPFLILSRYLFIDFVAAQQKSRHESFCKIGIDTESPEWTRLWRSLRETNDVGFDLDFSNFDGSLAPEVMFSCCDIINDWYEVYCHAHNTLEWQFLGYNLTPKMMRFMREEVFEAIVHTYQIAGFELYQKHLGNPSGNYLTANLNSLCHQMYLLMATGCVFQEDPGMNIEDCFTSAIYGDDGIVVPIRGLENLLNFPNFKTVMQSFGLTCTTAAKDGNDYIVKPLSDLTFLKRSFRQHHKYPHVMIAPIKKRTIQELINWQRESAFVSEEDQLIENLHCALNFMYHHSKSEYNDLKDKINTQLVLLGQSPIATSFEELDSKFLSQFENL